MLSCPHPTPSSHGREVRTRAHSRVHTQTRWHTIAPKRSSNEIHSTCASTRARERFYLEHLKTLFNAEFPKCPLVYIRSRLIVEFPAIDFHQSNYPSAQRSITGSSSTRYRVTNNRIYLFLHGRTKMAFRVHPKVISALKLLSEKLKVTWKQSSPWNDLRRN